MERERALQILKTLADGIDPYTGEQFPTDSPYQHSDTVRALFHAVQTLTVEPSARSRVRTEQDKAQRENAGRPWSEEEEGRLGKSFDAGKTLDQLSEEHKRSPLAIEARLAKLGKITLTSYLPSRGRSLRAESAVADYA